MKQMSEMVHVRYPVKNLARVCVKVVTSWCDVQVGCTCDVPGCPISEIWKQMRKIYETNERDL